jgi:hypothetical protein
VQFLGRAREVPRPRQGHELFERMQVEIASHGRRLAMHSRYRNDTHDALDEWMATTYIW